MFNAGILTPSLAQPPSPLQVASHSIWLQTAPTRQWATRLSALLDPPLEAADLACHGKAYLSTFMPLQLQLATPVPQSGCCDRHLYSSVAIAMVGSWIHEVRISVELTFISLTLYKGVYWSAASTR